MMSNGPPPARPDGTVDDARWLFPQERAPPPRDEGCTQNGFGDPALHASKDSPPTPSPPLKSSRPPSSVSTSFPTLVTMGGIAPDDACPPPAVLTEWCCYACHDSPGGSNMVNLCSGEQLWQPPASDWDVLEWDIAYSPNPEGTWYRVPGSVAAKFEVTAYSKLAPHKISNLYIRIYICIFEYTWSFCG